MNDEIRMNQTCCDCSTIVEVLNALRCWRCEGDWADMAQEHELPEQPEFVGDCDEAAEVQAWIWNETASGGQRGDVGSAVVEVAPPTARPQRSIVPVIWQGDLEYAVRFDLAAARYLVIYRFLTGGPEGIEMWRDSEIQPSLDEQRDGTFPSTAAVALAIALQAEHLSELADDIYCEVCGFSWPPDDACRLH